DEFDKLGARVSVNSGPAFVAATIEVKRENLPKVLALLTEVLQKPTFPADELDILKREMRDQLQKASTEPTMLAFRAVQRQLNPCSKEDVRYIPTLEEEISRLDAVTVDQLKQLYKQVSGQAATLVVIGDIDESSINGLVKLLNDWKADVAYTRVERP